MNPIYLPLAILGLTVVAACIRRTRDDPADDITDRDEWLDAMCERALRNPSPPHSLGAGLPGSTAHPAAGDKFLTSHNSEIPRV